MALTDTEIKKLKAREEEYQKADGNGLALIIRPKGTKTWRYEFRLDGKKKQKFHYGNYPETSLLEARKAHQIGRDLVAIGKHPSTLLDNLEALQMAKEGSNIKEIEAKLQNAREVEAKKQLMTFGELANIYKTKWVDMKWKNPDKGFNPVIKHLIPAMSELALESIDVNFIRYLIEEISEKSGVSIALRCLGWANSIFAYGMEHELCTKNPAALIKPKRIGEYTKRERWLKPVEIKKYLTALYQQNAYRGYKLGIHLCLIFAHRIEEMSGASWDEIDFEERIMTIPASRMKKKRDKVVTIPDQAMEMLRELKKLSGGSPYVFPMPTDNNRPMRGQNLRGVHNAVILTANIDDYHMHDHRHTISTNLGNQGRDQNFINAILSHKMTGIAGRYNHSEYIEILSEILQEWADFLDDIVTEKTVIQANFSKAV